MFGVARQWRSIRRAWRRMARRRMHPSVGARIILRSVGQVLHAGITISLVVCALALFGLLMVLGKSVRLTERPRQMARDLAGRVSWSRTSPDR